MTTTEIANRLVELCRQGQNIQAYQELFAPDAVAVEPARYNIPNTEGMQALLAKAENWQQGIIELHDSSVSDPVVADNHFALTMMIDLTSKEHGRNKMTEVCVYEVKDGKIVKEEFFH